MQRKILPILITVSPKPKNGLQQNLVLCFLLGPICSLRNDFESFSQVRDPEHIKRV